MWRPQAFYEHLAEANGLGLSTVGTLAELGHLSGKHTADAQPMLCFTPR